MPWWYAVAERDHELQNPTSADKIRLLGEYARLQPDSNVLDVACGKGGPALLLAREFGCRITGVERAPEFVAEARRRVHDAGLADRIEIVEQDAKEFRLEPESYDAALCIGASFVWDDLPGTLAALMPAVRAGGHVVVGEPYLQRPLPPEAEGEPVGVEGFVSLVETAGRFLAAGLHLEGIIASSLDDWDRYESLHWHAVEEWLAANADDPDAPAFRERRDGYRDRYLRWQRDVLGWAIFVARKR